MPSFTDFLTQFGLLSLAIGLWLTIFGPLLAIYCAWRFLKDVRRIAVALEAANVNPLDVRHKLFLEADAKRPHEGTGVVNSMFGR